MLTAEYRQSDTTIEAWRRAWREGFAPLLSVAALQALKRALIRDDPRLIQGATTSPPPLHVVREWPCEGACGLGYGGWQGEGLETVGEVDQRFAELCLQADQRLGEPAEGRWFLNWFDETPRDEMRRQLLPEVEDELDRRGAEHERTTERVGSGNRRL